MSQKQKRQPKRHQSACLRNKWDIMPGKFIQGRLHFHCLFRQLQHGLVALVVWPWHLWHHQLPLSWDHPLNVVQHRKTHRVKTIAMMKARLLLPWAAVLFMALSSVAAFQSATLLRPCCFQLKNCHHHNTPQALSPHSTWQIEKERDGARLQLSKNRYVMHDAWSLKKEQLSWWLDCVNLAKWISTHQMF